VILTLIFIGCGDKKETAPIEMSNILLENFPDIGLERTSDIKLYRGRFLWEYINGGAELYLLYNFVEAATADYKKSNTEIIVDIFLFGSSDDAFGIYSMFRSSDVQIVRLGIEGFVAPASVNFVKGRYLVRLVGCDESAESSLTLVNLADEINKLLAGTTSRPEMFNHFPLDQVIPSTEKYYVESFLDQKFLQTVYCQDYLIDGDTLTLFISPDQMGAKYLKWSEFAGRTNLRESVPGSLPFDGGYAFIFRDRFHGTIIAGLKSGKLAGIIGYHGKYSAFLAAWLNSL
jgi:hypothetical protein